MVLTYVEESKQSKRNATPSRGVVVPPSYHHLCRSLLLATTAIITTARMFRALDPARASSGDRRRQQQTSPVKGEVDASNNNAIYHGNNDKIRIVRDRTNETQTTAGESQATISSLSDIYSTDLLKDVYALSESESDTEYDAHNYSTEYIVSISKDRSLLDNRHLDDNMEIIDEVDLDAASESTTVASNHAPYATPYTSQSFPAIVKNSSWVDDKPFDEESILNMSDVGVGNKAAILPSYYSNNTIPVKEYILPPPSPVSLPSPPPTPSRGGQHVDEIIEISPDMETEKSQGRVAWTGDCDDDDSYEYDDYDTVDKESMATSTVTGSVAAKGAAVGAIGLTRSTISASSRERSFKSDKQLRARRLKVCIIAGFLVSLICLIIIIVSVALSKRNAAQDLAASAAQNEQTPAPSVDRDIFESPAPSLRATAPPSVVPSAAGDASPSESAPWLDDNNTSSSPTGNPSGEPTPSPTPAPTSEPTPQPTLEPTPSPTEDPTARPSASLTPVPTEPQAPTCASRISVAQDCFFMSDNVLVVEFENCDPQPDDWIGLYPEGSEFQEEGTGGEFLTDDWIAWAWSCGDQSCEVSPPANSFAFSVDPEDPAFNLFNLRAFLIRSSANGPPYQVIAKSDPFAIADPCNP